MKVKTEYSLFFTTYFVFIWLDEVEHNHCHRWVEAVGRFIRLGEGPKF
jgi:hypothetical protein